ncbi:hypothetical protein D3C72_1813510 [compost metagenome]
MELTQPPRAICPITSSKPAVAQYCRRRGTINAGKTPDRRKVSRNNRLKVAKPPSRCPVTTCGQSLSVTVHMPKAAWATTTTSKNNGSFRGWS